MRKVIPIDMLSQVLSKKTSIASLKFPDDLKNTLLRVNVESIPGVSPGIAHSTVLDTLASYGSSFSRAYCIPVFE